MPESKTKTPEPRLRRFKTVEEYELAFGVLEKEVENLKNGLKKAAKEKPTDFEKFILCLDDDDEIKENKDGSPEEE